MFFGRKRRIFDVAVILGLTAMIFAFTGCGTENDYENSPKLIEMETEAITENNQLYVLADLIFNMPAVCGEDGPGELRVTLGDRRVDPDDIEVLKWPSNSSSIKYEFNDVSDDQVIHLRIRTDSVENGILKIKASEKLTRFRYITDPTGKYSIKLFSVNKCIKSGAAVEMNSTEAQNISLTVKSPANKCDVMLIKLRDDDTDSTITPDAGTYDKLVDKSLIVKNEDYLNATKASTAKAIADKVNECYGSQVTASSSGSKVTMVSASTSDSHHYSLEIYEY